MKKSQRVKIENGIGQRINTSDRKQSLNNIKNET